jgi:hypothetical protein
VVEDVLGKKSAIPATKEVKVVGLSKMLVE